MNLITSIKKPSLSKKLTLALSISLILVGGAALCFYIFLSKYHAEIDLNIKSREYLNAMTETLTLPLWDVDEAKIIAIGNAYAENDLIVLIRISRDDGYSYFNLLKPGSKIMKEETVPIIHNSEVVGRLTIGLTTDYYKMLHWRFFRFYTLSLAIIILSLSVIIHILLGKYLKNPLTQFAGMIESYALGNEEAFDKQELYVEFKPFIELMKKMGGTINQQIKSLQSTQADLYRQKALFETMFNTIPDGVVIAGVDRKIQLVNRGMKSTFGYTPEELIGRSTEVLYQDHDKYKQTGINVFNEDSKKTGDLYIASYRDKNGRIFPGETFGAKLFDADRKWIGNLGIIRDITERKEAEKHLQQTQKMESIGSLAGGIAHDFNNLLSPIIGISEMLLEDLTSESSEYEYIKAIYEAGIRGGELVKQILSFSRQAELKKIPIRIQNILKEVVRLMRSTIPSDVEITISIDNECGAVMAEPTQIHQIIMNLVTNAYHALGQSDRKIGLTLEKISAEKARQEGFSAAAEYAVVSVTDNGCGIENGILGKIFDPYFTTKEQGKGTGLGLSVVYGIVTEHGGDIKIHSELGKGSTFRVYLPIMEKGSDPICIEDDKKDPAGTERILIVDDEESIAELEKRMLERLGYHVRACHNSLEAFELFSADPSGFDLVITDMTMPVMTGDQLTRKLLSVRPDIPVIICTGFSERLEGETVESLGIKGLLMKPLLKSAMAHMIRKTLDES